MNGDPPDRARVLRDDEIFEPDFVRESVDEMGGKGGAGIDMGESEAVHLFHNPPDSLPHLFNPQFTTRSLANDDRVFALEAEYGWCVGKGRFRTRGACGGG